MSNPALPAEPARPTTAAPSVRGPGIGIAAALALVTAALEVAIVAFEPTDQARTIVLTLAIWFQGAWALLLWRRPDRDLLAVGLFANAALFAGTAVAVALGSDQWSPSAPQLLAMAGQAGLIVCCLSMLVGRPARAPHGTLPIALTTGLVALGLAAVSLTVTAPLALPGTSEPIAGSRTATGVGQPATAIPAAAPIPSPSLAAGIALAAPPPSDSPSSAGAGSPSAPAATGTSPTPGSATTDPTTVAPPTPAATLAIAASAVPTPQAAATTAGTPRAPSTTRPTSAPTTSPLAASTPGPTPRPTLRSTPTPRPTPSPTPRPTPEPTPSPTPIPTPEATVAPGDPGTIAFGRDYDPDTLALIGPTRTLHVGQQVAWRADLTEPAGTTTLTFTVTEPLPSGKEFPHWQQDFSVADPSFSVLAKRVDMSVYVHDEPGNYIMRIRRGADGEILAEGTFTVLP